MLQLQLQAGLQELLAGQQASSYSWWDHPCCPSLHTPLKVPLDTDFAGPGITLVAAAFVERSSRRTTWSMLLSKKVIHRNFLRESSALNQVQQLHVLVPLDRLMKFVRLDFSTVWQHPLTITMFQGGQPHVLWLLSCTEIHTTVVVYVENLKMLSVRAMYKNSFIHRQWACRFS